MSNNDYAEYGFVCSDIRWDTDGADVNLPTETAFALNLLLEDVNDDFTITEIISDYISDKFGFCHFGFTWKMVDFNDAEQVEHYRALNR